MTTDYTCPKCKAHLLLNDYLILTANKANEHGMLLLMNPEVGNYETVYHPSYEMKDGERFTFSCPVCHKTLGSDLNESLVMVLMKDEMGKEFELHFSAISGQKCTYKIMGNSVSTFGIDAPHYLDVMGVLGLT